MQLEQINTDTVRRLAKVSKFVEKQQRFDAAVAAANAPPETLRPLAKQLKKRIKEISANG